MTSTHLKTMRAVRIEEFGDEDVLRPVDLPAPEPAGGEVAVAVKACALNHLDLRVRRGEFPWLALPLTPGTDVAGVEEATGRKVVVYPLLACGVCPACLEGRDQLCPELRLVGMHRDGGLAERIVVPAANIFPVPDTWDFAEWAAAPLVFLAAWHALVTRANLRVGETVLVHSAGSGIGTAAIQIASRGGARVIATAASPAKLARAREIGAHETVNVREVDFADAVRDLTGGRGVDVVVDHVGGAVLGESLSCLARGGRLISLGETGDPSATLALRPLFHRERSVIGSSLGSRKEFRDVLALLADKTLKPVVDATFPLAQAAEAHRYLAGRHAFGKVVVVL